MVLAFRLYGDFYWPPHAKVTDLEGETRRGLVEIHYQKKPGSEALRPLLRWLTGEIAGDPGEPGDIQESIFKHKQKEAAEWFADRADRDCAIWIDEGGAGDGDWLSFRGAFLIDQYRLSATGGKADLDLRWPLVRACQYVKGMTVLSGIVIGRAKSPRFYLDLNLPLPARRSTRPGEQDLNPPAFPFGAVFEPGGEDCLQFTTLVGGWIRRDAVAAENAKDFETSFVFASDRYPRTPLGSFGFAARGDVEHGQFAIFDGKQRDLDITAANYWPADARVFTQDMLHRFGFSTDAASAKWLTLKTGASTADLSLRFAKTGDPRKPVLVYRAAVSGKAGTATDIKSDGRTLSLRLEDEAGGWIETGETLRADCRLSWVIEDNTVWAPEDWRPEVDLTLHWNNALADKESLHEEPKKSRDGIGMLRAAARSARQARQGLAAVEAFQPASFLPDLHADGSHNICLALSGPKIRAVYQPDTGVATWGNSNADIPFPRPRMRLTLAEVADLISRSDDTNDIGDNVLALSASGQSFFAGDDKAKLVLVRDHGWPNTGREQASDSDAYFASYLIGRFEPEQAWSGRLASLRFDWTAETEEDPGKSGKLERVRPADDFSAWLRIGTRAGRSSDAPVAVALQLFLPVSDVQPAGVDVARADRTNRAAPLLIAQDRAGNPASGTNYWLAVRESVGGKQDRRIEMDIYENAPDTGQRAYVVLSQDPFSIFRYTHQPLSDRGDAGSASVAYYSGDERIWQYRKVAGHYHFTFPPQAVGESADKPGRLEIHDLGEPVEGDPDDRLRPYVTDPKKPSNGLKRRAVEFRLTPSAEIWIRPSDVERGYFMPESASYELFRQRGEYGLGASLAFLRAEFLYGLPVGIDVSKEGPVSRQARVAEIEALTGRLAGPARDAKAEPQLASRWNALSEAARRRPERLEIWARDPASALDFTPARFSNGVSFSLRGTALHRAPLERLEQPDDGGLWPKAGRGDLAAETGKPRTHPQGLSGGALWPVESINLFNALMKNPESAGGTIESIALSPTGGDAVQKAAFLGGMVTIISETRNGHIERQKVEVIGRIGAFWHRAKHVVVYERTVNIPTQFAPEFDEDPHFSRSRRPILRKVREFVELLQSERTYPDFSEAAPRHAGFLERVRFNSKVINVDSSWASEIGTDGWKIPLWNRHSARQRPQVYPMPDVAFVTVAEGDGEKPVVPQECLDTDNLFFFCDFSAGTDDTDSWRARRGIDYAEMPPAEQIAAVSDASADAGAGKRRKSVGRILPGLRRFTWRLAPAARKTAVNAGRFGKPVYVGLESVSFMRATHVGTETGLKQDLNAILKLARNLPAPGTGGNISLPHWDSNGTGAATTAAEGFSKGVEALSDALRSRDNAACEDALKKLGEAWTAPGLKDAIAAALLPAGQMLATHLADWKKIDLPPLGNEKSACEKLKSDAVLAIRRKEMLLRTALGDWLAGVDDVLGPIKDDPLLTKAAVIDVLCTDIRQHLEPLFLKTGADIGRLGENVEKARAILLDFENDLDIVIQRARRRIEDYAAAYDRDKPWSPQRRNSFRTGLRASIDNVSRDISSAIDEARQRLAIELDDACQAAGGHIARALSAIAALDDVIPKDVTFLEPAVTKLMEPLHAVLERLAPSSGGDGDLAKLRQDLTSAPIDPDLKNRAQAKIDAVETAAARLRTAATKAAIAAGTIDALAEAGASKLEAAVSALTTGLSTCASELQIATTSLFTLADDLGGGAAEELRKDVARIHGELAIISGTIADRLDSGLTKIADAIDPAVRSTIAWLAASLSQARPQIIGLRERSTVYFDEINDVFDAVQTALGPEAMLQNIVIGKGIRPAIEKLLAPLPEQIAAGDREAFFATIRDGLDGLGETTGKAISTLDETALEGAAFISTICSALFESANDVTDYIKGLSTDAEQFLKTKFDDLAKPFEDMKRQVEEALAPGGDLAGHAVRLSSIVKAFDYSVRGLQNDLCRTMESARMYGDRVFDAVASLGDGGAMAAPSNILRLYSAASSAPELAAMKADIDRIRANFDEIGDVIKTTEANALFDRLGDGLKALGLTLPFDRIDDRLIPADLTRFDIGEVFGNFGGINLENLFKGCKIPEGVSDAVRISHDFDKAQARAWVQIDIDVPLPGRRTLFSLGVFQIDFIDMHLTGRVRLEVSKDQSEMTQTGFSRIGTIIDVVVAGQSMVGFEKFGLNFARESGLRTEFDPKNIRLNPSFKFIQDFLSTLFPQEAGGLKIVKQDNIPVGIEHIFAIPPMTLNFGTSGVSNISIENQFKLLAFPDFVLANQFNLSSVERPFIFSVFIIGGTGYVQIDTEYRPFDSQLMVSVEAGAGGSAALAFAVGPFVGQVFITLSGVLTYRKMIGKPGGGLSLAVVVVIAGQVQVCGMVSVGITLMLRMSYRDNGDITGQGTLSVSIRISRFFKITARANVDYKLRGGKSETSVNTQVGATTTPNLTTRIEQARQAVDQLQRASN